MSIRCVGLKAAVVALSVFGFIGSALAQTPLPAPSAPPAQAPPAQSPPAQAPPAVAPPPADAPPQGGGFVPPPSDLPGQNPLDLAPINIGTLQLSAGGIGGFERQAGGGSSDLAAGIDVVEVEFLGLAVKAATFKAAVQPTLDTGILSGSLVQLDQMMFGKHYPDKPICPAFPTVLCDQDSGYWGLGTTILSFASDLGAHRTGLRIVEGDFVGSVTPAFGKDWKRYRFLPRIGASLDWFNRRASGDAGLVGRGMLGFDASFVIGPVYVEPSFRWRPSTSDFVHDYTLEPRLEIFAKSAWAAWHDRDALRFGVEVGFTHASMPDNAFGADLVAKAQNTLYAKVVVAPTIFTFGPP